MPQFYPVVLEKFSSCGNVVEEIPNLDDTSLRSRVREIGGDFTILELKLSPHFAARRIRLELHMRYGSNRRHSFPSKSTRT